MAADARAADVTAGSALVNRALTQVGGRRYLEVGIKTGATFQAVEADIIVGVDPYHEINVATCREGMSVVPRPSDWYFRNVDEGTEFDVVFVDGLHVFRQAYRDIINALGVLAPGGAVIVDDAVPPNELSALPERVVKAWTGDVYKAVIILAEDHPELVYRVFRSGVDGAPRALVWKKDPAQVSVAAGEPALARLDRVSYADVFLPDAALGKHFTEVSEDVAFAAWAETARPSATQA
jgi:hypothetical protein